MSDSINSENFTTTVMTKTELKCMAHNYISYYIHVSDKFDCFMFQLPFYLYDVKFGHFAASLTLPIILISIFGRIKFQYRWFILNMALIDLFNSLDFICNMPTLLSPALETASYSCGLYSSLPFNSWFYVEIVTHLPPIGVFLLSFSRFISVYFPKFYIKNAKTSTVLLFIFVINYLHITTIFIVSRNRDAVNTAIYEENELFDGKDNFEERENFLEKAANKKFLLLTIYCLIPAIILFFSIIFFSLMVVKIIFQLKFQAKSNAELFKSNIRIIIILSFQTFMLCILLPLEAMYQYDQPISPEFQPYYPFFNFPLWIYGFISENGVRCFREFRVFFDSLIILVFIKGYRNDFCEIILWIPKTMRKWLNKFKHKFGKTSAQLF